MKKIFIISLVIICAAILGVNAYAEPKIWVNQDFEQGHQGVAITAKSNNVSVQGDESGHYLEFDMKGAESALADIKMLGCESSVVMSADVKITQNSSLSGALFYIKDNTSGIGQELLYMKTVLPYMTVNSEYHIDIVVNMQAKNYNAYINNRKIVSYTIKDEIREISFARIFPGGIGKIQIDNLKIYSGTEITDIGTDEVINRSFYSDAYVQGKLEDKSAIHTASGQIYKNGAKQALLHNATTVGEAVYISAQDFTDFSGLAVNVADNVASIGNHVKMNLKYNEVTVDGKSYVCDERPKYVNSVLMLPFDEVCKYVDYTYSDGKGLYIFSSQPILLSDTAIEEINLYMFYQRPTTEMLKTAFTENQHPYVMTTAADFQRLKLEVVNNSVKKAWYEEISAQADALLTQSPCTYTLENGRIFNTAREISKRLNMLSFMYRITDDEKYSDRALEEIRAVLDFPDWNSNRHFLDTAEIMTAFAIAYDRLYDVLSEPENEDIKMDMKDKVMEYGLNPAYDAYYGSFEGDSFWISTNSNWGAVCNGAVIITAAVFMEDENADRLFQLIANAIRGFEYSFYAIAPDGAWDEGGGYWGYFMEFSGRTLKALDTVFGSDFGITKQLGTKNIGYYIYNISSDYGINNFGDATALSHPSTPMLFYYADKLGDKRLNFTRINDINSFDCNVQTEDIIYFNGEMEAALELDKDVYYRNSEIVTMRGDDSNAFLSFSGGKNSGTHRHYDAGAFVLDLLGERWAIDLGADKYTYQDTDSNRYKFYRVRAEGHNTLVINPDDAAGQSLAGDAVIIQRDFDEGSSYAIMNMTDMYAEDASSVKRGFYLAEDRSSAVLRDEVSLKASSDVYWFMHTDAEATVNGNRVILTKNSKKIVMEFETNTKAWKLEIVDAAPFATSPTPNVQMENGTFKKISFMLPQGTGEVYINVRIYPDGQKGFMYNTSLDRWDLQDIFFEDVLDSGISDKWSAENTLAPVTQTEVNGKSKYNKALMVETKENGSSSISFDLGDALKHDRYTIGFSLYADSIKVGDRLLVNGGVVADLSQLTKDCNQEEWNRIFVEVDNKRNICNVGINGIKVYEYIFFDEHSDKGVLTLSFAEAGKRRIYTDDVVCNYGAASNLQKNGEITITENSGAKVASVTMERYKPESCAFIFAKYDGDKLMDVSITEDIVSGITQIKAELSKTDGATYKAMLWNSLSEMVPIIN